MPVNLKLLGVEIGGMFVVVALALFPAAGTVGWPAGWAFLVLFFSFVVALSLWLLRHNPGLLTERMTGVGKPDQKAWDKVFYGLANLVFLAWLVLERTVRAELPGYDAYMAQVKYRLVPHVW